MWDPLKSYHICYCPARGCCTAAALAARHNLTLYDAAFAALALALDAELVTTDRQLAASGACRMRLLGG